MEGRQVCAVSVKKLSWSPESQRVRSSSEPAFSAEEPQHEHRDDRHDTNDQGEAPLPVEFGYVSEVTAREPVAGLHPPYGVAPHPVVRPGREVRCGPK